MRKFTYPQAVRYLDDCLIFGIKPSLIRINKLLELLGNPDRKADSIHIVGTNGKTSTTIMTANILYGHGIRCGFHISPHINEYTERLWFCGNQICRDRFASLLNDIFSCIDKVNMLDLGGPMTQFEIVAAMAFELASQENLQVMVLEAGMGGRWDATNAADSKIVGLTGVSLEHTEILGKTIKEISGYKGVIEFDTSKPDGMKKKQLDITRATILGWKANGKLVEDLERTYNDFAQNYEKYTFVK